MMIDTNAVFYRTVVAFGLITVFIYFFVLRRFLPSGRTAASGGAAHSNNTANNTRGDARIAGRRQQQQQTSTSVSSSSNSSQKPACTRVPPHVSEPSARVAQWGGMNLLVEGVVPFRYTKAALHEKQQQQQQQQNSSPHASSSSSSSSSTTATSVAVAANNRKDRARILTNLFHDATSSSHHFSVSSTAPPPDKGSTIVISIPQGDLECPKLRRVLYLLGTYYNIMLIIVVDSSFSIKEMSTLRNKLRGEEQPKDKDSASFFLSADILPDHRIVAASTISARVAFTRQLARKDLLVLDFDAQVSDQLMRFGHRVITYGLKDGDDKEFCSRLGRLLHA